MTARSHTWLYAVAPGDADPAALTGLGGVAGEHPRLIDGGGLAAVVGTVPGSDFDAPALQRHLEDPRWLEQAVRAHHRVIDTLARAGHTLPVRFATLYRDDRRVLGLLEEHRRAFRAAIERVADRTEWGVKAYLDAAHDHDRQEDDAGDDPAPDRPGTAYLLRRRAARDRTAQVLEDAVERARRVHQALSAFAGEAAEHPLQPPEATGIRDPMLLNGAYLVDRSRADELARLVADLRDTHAGVLRVELTGPWPPYSFVDLPIAADEE
ncbi:GvpL/GvpF family gas vesicle protein [Kitasatospora sp. NPDC127111]|uniref:GvpL/GvpF family gas vesicle protein n=1 Tax=Kitasatospora sp. NPDC127111 TaxID=3345363 RepID=UPI00362CDC4D